MTAQLILLNGLGVAVASDSAVTLAGGRRTYDTADKIIPLPLPHRVAALHSGSVLLNGIPYQVLLHEWATTLGDHPLASVAEYRRSFVTWVLANQQWFTAKRQIKDCVAQLNSAFERLHQLVEAAVSSGQPGAPDVLALAALRTAVQELDECPSFEDADEPWLDKVMSTLAAELEEGFTYWFDDLPRSPAIDDCLRDYTRRFVQRGMWDSRTILAFTGFGSAEILPGYATVVTAGILQGLLLHLMQDPFVGSTEHRTFCGICPLGQTGAIDLFLRGFDSRNIDVAADAAGRTLRAMSDELRPLLGDEKTSSEAFDEVMAKAEQRLGESIATALWQVSDESFLKPLRWAISGLPPATLAAVAKSLVELQALRQTTTAEQSTVGGPIDVATISRARGFEWVAHKTKPSGR